MCKPQNNWISVHFCALWCFFFFFSFCKLSLWVDGQVNMSKKGWDLCVVSPPSPVRPLPEKSSTNKFQLRVSLSHWGFFFHGLFLVTSVHTAYWQTHGWPRSPFEGPATPHPPPLVFLHSLMFSFIHLKRKGYLIPCSCWTTGNMETKTNVTLGINIFVK